MNHHAIPQALKDSASWCVWRYQTRDGESKATKVPYNPVTGWGAKSNDRRTFARFGQALMSLEMNGYDGLGIGVFDDLCVIDLDHCVDEDGAFTDLTSEILCEMDTYAEISPGGDGVHLYFRAPGLTYDKDKYYIKNPHNGIEIYVAGATNRFITVTGNALTDAGLNDRTEQLQKILDRHMRRKEPKKKAHCSAPCIVLNVDDNGALKMARNAKNGGKFSRLMDGDASGYKSRSEADMALCCLLAFWTSNNADQMDRIFRSSGMFRAEKWDRKTGASTYGAMTIQSAINATDRTYSELFTERFSGGSQPMPKMIPRGGGRNRNN